MNKRILVVDDESSIREALSKVLQAEDYQVDSAGSEAEAIEKFEAGNFDLLLLDLGLPVKDGWSTLAWLDRVNPLLPIVIITGRNNQRELAERAGAAALMEKPLDVPQLLQTIRKLVDEPIESRVNRASGFRYVPDENELVRETLLKQETAPYPYTGLKGNGLSKP